MIHSFVSLWYFLYPLLAFQRIIIFLNKILQVLEVFYFRGIKFISHYTTTIKEQSWDVKCKCKQNERICTSHTMSRGERIQTNTRSSRKHLEDLKNKMIDGSQQKHNNKETRQNNTAHKGFLLN